MLLLTPGSWRLVATVLIVEARWEGPSVRQGIAEKKNDRSPGKRGCENDSQEDESLPKCLWGWWTRGQKCEDVVPDYLPDENQKAEPQGEVEQGQHACRDGCDED